AMVMRLGAAACSALSPTDAAGPDGLHPATAISQARTTARYPFGNTEFAPFCLWPNLGTISPSNAAQAELPSARRLRLQRQVLAPLVDDLRPQLGRDVDHRRELILPGEGSGRVEHHARQRQAVLQRHLFLFGRGAWIGRADPHVLVDVDRLGGIDTGVDGPEDLPRIVGID